MTIPPVPPPAAPATTLVLVQPVEPSAADIGRFEAALAPPRVIVRTPETAPPPETEPAVATPDALGERILASVERMRVDYQHGMGRVDATMHQEDMRLSDAMRLMVDTMRMSLQQEMFGKMVGRTTQNLDQLLKGQ